MQIIHQNEALIVSFSKKLVPRSSDVTQGQIAKKGPNLANCFKRFSLKLCNERHRAKFCIFTFQVESEDYCFLNFVFKEMFIERSSHLE